MPVPFPPIKPTSRSYNPGSYPQTVFEAQNGTKTVVRFGAHRVDAELSMAFDNITDAEALLILQNYEQVNAAWDYVTFTEQDGLVGTGLSDFMGERASGLRYRYADAPSIQSVVPGISSVRCKFTASLDPE